jgi:hypothetical protein
MDERATKQELLDAIRAELAQRPVDLRPLLALQCEHGPAVKRAAERWGVTPESVVSYER